MATEKRLIDANDVVESLTNFTPNGWGKDVPYIRSQWAMAVKIKDNFMKAISEAPTVDAMEVVHGRWELVCKNVRKCPSCKKERNTDDQRGWYSCPFCGCIMDLPQITDQTQAALAAMDRNIHTEDRL